LRTLVTAGSTICEGDENARRPDLSRHTRCCFWRAKTDLVVDQLADPLSPIALAVKVFLRREVQVNANFLDPLQHAKHVVHCLPTAYRLRIHHPMGYIISVRRQIL